MQVTTEGLIAGIVYALFLAIFIACDLFGKEKVALQIRKLISFLW